MSDAYAEAGYTTLMPDLFNGDFVPNPRPDGFDLQGWIAGGTTGKDPHTAEQIDPVVVAGVQTLKEMGFTRIAAVGYCFGAKVC